MTNTETRIRKNTWCRVSESATGDGAHLAGSMVRIVAPTVSKGGESIVSDIRTTKSWFVRDDHLIPQVVVQVRSTNAETVGTLIENADDDGDAEYAGHCSVHGIIETDRWNFADAIENIRNHMHEH